MNKLSSMIPDFSKLSDIRITTKLVILFAVLTVGFFGIGLTYYMALDTQQTADARTNKLLQYGQLIEDAKVRFAEVRADERDFLINLTDAPVTAHQAGMDKLHGLMDRLEALAPNDYSNRLIDQADSVLSDYEQNFSEVVGQRRRVGVTETQGLRGEALVAVNAAEDAITKTANLPLYQSMARMRALQKEIIDTVDRTAYVQQFVDEKAHFDALLQDASISKAAKTGIGNSMNRYASLVDRIISGLRRADSYTELYDFMLGPIFDEMGDSSQRLVAENQQVQQQTTQQITTVFTIALVLIALLVSVGLFLFARTLSSPLRALQNTVARVSAGDLQARTHLTSRDELGQLSDAFDQLLDDRVAAQQGAEQENERLNNSIIDLIKAVGKVSQQKDLSVKVPVSEDVTGAVADSLNLLTSETAKVFAGVKGISVQVSGVSADVKMQSDIVMSVSESEHQEVQKTAQSLRESVVAMNKIAKEAQSANEKAGNTIKNTERAVDTVNKSVEGINAIRDTIAETEKRIKRLGERSQEITGIVNLINSIAERTHILALNASMHAASAGEAGRGFAVVADEVQRLAENAREATSQISTLVNNIRVETADTVTTMNTAISQVAEGTKLAEQAGESMRQTQQSTSDLVASVEQITKSSMTQVDVSNKLLERAKQILKSTEQTGQQLREQSSNTDSLVKFAEQLVEAVDVFALPADKQQQVEAATASSASEASMTKPATAMRGAA